MQSEKSGSFFYLQQWFVLKCSLHTKSTLFLCDCMYNKPTNLVFAFSHLRYSHSGCGSRPRCRFQRWCPSWVCYPSLYPCCCHPGQVVKPQQEILLPQLQTVCLSPQLYPVKQDLQMPSSSRAHWKRFEAGIRTRSCGQSGNGHLAWMTPYLLLVPLSVGLPVSMGSGELSSLELLAKKMRKGQGEKKYIFCIWSKLYLRLS